MEYIKFGDTAFEIVSMGIIENTYTKRRTFYFKTDLDYASVESILTNADNLSSIKHVAENNIIRTTYSDCISLKVLSKNIETGIYVAEFSTDDTELKIKLLEAQVEALTKLQTNATITTTAV